MQAALGSVTDVTDVTDIELDINDLNIDMNDLDMDGVGMTDLDDQHLMDDILDGEVPSSSGGESSGVVIDIDSDFDNSASGKEGRRQVANLHTCVLLNKNNNKKCRIISYVFFIVHICAVATFF